MSKFRLKLSNELILGPYTEGKVRELIDEGKVSKADYIQDFPLGDWEPIIESEFFDEPELELESDSTIEPETDPVEHENQSTRNIKSNKFQEFSFEKKDHKFEVGGEEPDQSAEKENGEEEVDAAAKVDETVILKTKQFKQIDKTVVVKSSDINLDAENKAENSNEDSEQLNEEDLPEEEIVTSDDKTQVLNLKDVSISETLTNAAETEAEFEQVNNEESVEADEINTPVESSTDDVGEDSATELEKVEKDEKRKKIIYALVILVGLYFYLDDSGDKKTGPLVPKKISISFPTPSEIADDVIASEKFRLGKKHYLDFRKNRSFEDLALGISNFKLSLEKSFRKKNKVKDGNGVEKEITEISDAVDYLILLYSFALEYSDEIKMAGETFHRLVMLVEPRVYKNVLIAEGVARYYLQFNKINAAQNTIENYLRISKKPTLELFSLYLEIIVRAGNMVKAKEIVDTLSKQKVLPIDGYLAISEYYLFNEQPQDVFNVLQNGLKIYPSSPRILLAAINFLIKDKRTKELPKLFEQVYLTNGSYSKRVISRFYEYRGMSYAIEGKFPKAVENFKYSLKIDKNPSLQNLLSSLEVGGTDVVEKLILDSKAEVLIRAAKKELMKGELDKALRLAVEASDFSDNNVKSKVFLSQVQLRKGLFNSAISMLEKYSKLNNGDHQLEAALIRAYTIAYKTNEAFKRLRILSNTKFGSTSEYQYLLGMLYEKENNLYMASKSFEVSVQLDPLFDEGFHKLGEIYLSVRRYKYAKDRVNKAIQLNPSNPKYYVTYSRILYELNGVDMAIGYLRDQLKKFPNSPRVLSQIAQFYYRSGLQKDYLRYRDMFFAQAIFDASFYEFLINEAKREGKTDEIVKYSNKYLKFDGSNLDITFNLGKHFLGVGKAEDAKKVFTELKDKLSTFPLINYYLAKTHIELKDFEKAKEYGNLEKKLNPNKSNGDAVLGLISKIEGEYPKAIKHYEKAISLNSKDAEALLDLGWIRAKQLEFSRAKDLVTRAKAVDPDNARVYKELGYIFKGLGQSALAIQYFETYLKMNALGKDKGIIKSEINKLKF